MSFAVRTAKEDRQAQLTALHAAHAHVEGYAAAPDDSDDARYQGHFYVTNQEAYEHKGDTVRVTCPTEAVATQVAAVLNDAQTAGGCWYDKVELIGRGKRQKKKVTRTFAPWAHGKLPPPELARYLLHPLLMPAWREHAKARVAAAAAPPPPPAPAPAPAPKAA